MSAISLIRLVYSRGGRLALEDGKLVLMASAPLPAELIQQLVAEKPALMVALGAPFNTAVSAILSELRPNLPQALRDLPDSKLLVMVNWSIMEAWQRTMLGLGKAGHADD